MGALPPFLRWTISRSRRLAPVSGCCQPDCGSRNHGTLLVVYSCHQSLTSPGRERREGSGGGAAPVGWWEWPPPRPAPPRTAAPRSSAPRMRSRSWGCGSWAPGSGAPGGRPPGPAAPGRLRWHPGPATSPPCRTPRLHHRRYTCNNLYSRQGRLVGRCTVRGGGLTLLSDDWAAARLVVQSVSFPHIELLQVQGPRRGGTGGACQQRRRWWSPGAGSPRPPAPPAAGCGPRSPASPGMETAHRTAPVTPTRYAAAGPTRIGSGGRPE